MKLTHSLFRYDDNFFSPSISFRIKYFDGIHITLYILRNSKFLPNQGKFLEGISSFEHTLYMHRCNRQNRLRRPERENRLRWQKKLF